MNYKILIKKQIGKHKQNSIITCGKILHSKNKILIKRYDTWIKYTEFKKYSKSEYYQFILYHELAHGIYRNTDMNTEKICDNYAIQKLHINDNFKLPKTIRILTNIERNRIIDTISILTAGIMVNSIFLSIVMNFL